MSEEYSESFEHWWYLEGSGMPPISGEEASEHVERVSRIAWANGASNAKHSAIARPIPLSERKPGPEDLLASGPCSLVWLGHEIPGGYWSWELTDACFAPDHTHWLPGSTKYLPARVEG